MMDVLPQADVTPDRVTRCANVSVDRRSAKLLFDEQVFIIVQIELELKTGHQWPTNRGKQRRQCRVSLV